MPSRLTEEIAASAARLVVEEGLDYGAAKRRAARDLGANPRSSELPGNDVVEDEVREYLALFCADTQPGELAELRRIAMRWMERLERFRPHLTGAVWRGTATRLNDVHIELFCDDSKAAELALLDLNVDYEVGSTSRPNGKTVDVLSVASTSRELGVRVVVLFTVLDYDDLRGALKLDPGGRSLRGDLAAVRAQAAP